MIGAVDAGERCHSCGDHDFLPIACRHCARPFCAAHATSHACDRRAPPASDTRRVDSGAPSAKERKSDHRQAVRNSTGRRCAACTKGLAAGGSAYGVNDVPPVVLTCPGCGYVSCIRHRHHDCDDLDVDDGREFAEDVKLAAARRRAAARPGALENAAVAVRRALRAAVSLLPARPSWMRRAALGDGFLQRQLTWVTLFSGILLFCAAIGLRR
jgi:hypothetical protein